MYRFLGEGYFKEAVCPGSMAGSLWRTIKAWGKTSPYAVGLAHPTLTGSNCTRWPKSGGAQVLTAFLWRRGQRGWEAITLLGINSSATADEATLDPTRGVFNRPPVLGVLYSTCGWKVEGLSTGIVLLTYPGLPLFPCLYLTDNRVGEDDLGGRSQTRPEL